MRTMTLLLLAFITFGAMANDGKYAEAMTKQIEAVYKAQTIEELAEHSKFFFDELQMLKKQSGSPTTTQLLVM
jgi:hypothetical protein